MEEEKTPQIHIGERLKQYRKEENIKAVNVANMLGITRQHYSIIERNKDMKFSMLLKVCSVVGLPLSYFLLESGYEHLSSESDEKTIELRKKILKVEKVLNSLIKEIGAS